MRQHAAEAELFHPRHEPALILRVTRETRRHAPLLPQLLHRLRKGPHDMGRRSKAPFAMTFFHAGPLVVNIERNRSGPPFAFGQLGFSRDDKPKARHALNAFVRRGDDEINAEHGDVQRNAAEGAHGIHKEDAPLPFHDSGNRRERVEHAGGRFIVNADDVRDGGVAAEGGLESPEVRRREFAGVVDDSFDLERLGDAREAVAVFAVGEDEQLSIHRHRRANHRFDRERPAALHEHRGVIFRLRGRRKFHQAIPDWSDDAEIVVIIPRTPVAQQGGPDGWTGRKRSRRQQDVRILPVELRCLFGGGGSDVLHGDINGEMDYQGRLKVLT